MQLPKFALVPISLHSPADVNRCEPGTKSRPNQHSANVQDGGQTWQRRKLLIMFLLKLWSFLITMDVMKPTLINIGGRCYRKMPFEQKIEPYPEQASNSAQRNDEGRHIIRFIHTKETQYRSDVMFERGINFFQVECFAFLCLIAYCSVRLLLSMVDVCIKKKLLVSQFGFPCRM